MCSINSNNGFSLNSAESLNSAKKHYSVLMLIKLTISLSLNSAVSLNSAAISTNLTTGHKKRLDPHNIYIYCYESCQA